jgi:hypothetical protein
MFKKKKSKLLSFSKHSLNGLAELSLIWLKLLLIKKLL